jgi:hypothetical protein
MIHDQHSSPWTARGEAEDAGQTPKQHGVQVAVVAVPVHQNHDDV